MDGYVYIEYPKCLYNQDGSTLTVDNKEEEDAAAQLGWMTAEKYHHTPAEVVAPPPPPAVVEGDPSHAIDLGGE